MRTCALGLPSRATASRQGTNRIIAALSESFEFEMFELPERAGKACFLTAPLFCPGFVMLATNFMYFMKEKQLDFCFCKLTLLA